MLVYWQYGNQTKKPTLIGLVYRFLTNACMVRTKDSPLIPLQLMYTHYIIHQELTWQLKRDLYLYVSVQGPGKSNLESNPVVRLFKMQRETITHRYHSRTNLIT